MKENFKHLNLKTEYTTGQDNITKDFYEPIFESTVYYMRAVGFFSSTSLTKLTKGISKLITNKTKIEFIVSPQLSENDIEQIRLGYELRDVIQNRIVSEIEKNTSLSDQKRLGVISQLIESGQLDIKIALTKSNDGYGIFHVKYGIMLDKQGNVIAYSGSLNDSITAYDYNFENFDVYCSWISEESKLRALNKLQNFKDLWNNKIEMLKVVDFPVAAKEKLLKIRRNFSESELILEMIETEEEDTKVDVSEDQPNPDYPKLRSYQSDAIEIWQSHDYRGIYEMATGAGKTITAIGSILELYKLKGKLFVIIVVPYQHLVEQWVEELNNFKISSIIGYSNSTYSDYINQLKNKIINYDIGVEKLVCFVTTIGTYRLDKTQNVLNRANNDYLIIVDEAHNIGTKSLQSKLLNFKYRLALSATLDRHNDIEGTKFIRDYFGETCIEYDIDRAIKEKALCNYKYFPVLVYLDEYELEKYQQLSKEIAKVIYKDAKNKRFLITEKAKILLLKRSRIVAGAKLKINALLNNLENYKSDNGMLIYCGSTTMIDEKNVDNDEELKQIEIVSKRIWEVYGIKNSQFTSQEDKEQRHMIIENFKETDIQAIVAIRCLDEGVNIPSIKTAFILASSTNPKEYIQRRGRVLRPSINKDFAEIYDYITLPRNLKDIHLLSESELKMDSSLVSRELSRLKEFSRLSINKSYSDKIQFEIENAYGHVLLQNEKEGEKYDK